MGRFQAVCSYWCAFLVTVVVSVPPASAQVRMVDWNVAQMRGDEASLAAVIAELDLDDHAGFAAPVAVLTCQEVTQATYDTLLGLLGADWSSATYTNQSEDNYGGAQACFYRPAIVTEDPAGHDDLYTQAGRRCDRWLFSLNGHTDPPVEFYVYSAHLKAGNNSSSEQDRETGANRILQDLGKLPATTRAVVTGDMNFYDNAELGYLAFISAGLYDPLGTGSWSGDEGAIKHSQSPRTIAAGGLANGGLDDRFDFQLCTSVMSGSGGLTVMADTYRSMGNDGNHYNVAINEGTNTYYPEDTARSDDLADVLHDASDHLPVVVDYRLPAVLEAVAGSCGGETVIEGYDLACEIAMSNAAAPLVPEGAADLSWTLSGTGACAGNAGSGTIAPGNDALQAISVDTSTAGTYSGSIEITAQDELAQGSPFTLDIAGQVLRPANPSFSNDEDLTLATVDVAVQADSGMASFFVPVWNRGWDSDQARMDIDGAETVDPVSCTDCQWTNLAGFPANLPFMVDTTGLGAGTLIRWVYITASDQDLPGENAYSLHLTVRIEVTDPPSGCDGDLNGDGVTDISDLLVLLDGWGTNDPALDLDGSGLVDIEDLLLLLSDFGCG